MSEKAKRIRTAGVVPADYRGPIYWRLVQYYPLTGKGGEPIEFLDSRNRQARLWIDRTRMPGKDIFTSGTMFDGNGGLLPEWKKPLKAKWTNNRPVRVEYAAGSRSARVSERVYDAIQALEPGKHHAFPIDIIRSDGTTERRYELFFAQDATWRAGAAPAGEQPPPLRQTIWFISLSSGVLDGGGASSRKSFWISGQSGRR